MQRWHFIILLATQQKTILSTLGDPGWETLQIPSPNQPKPSQPYPPGSSLPMHRYGLESLECWKAQWLGEVPERDSEMVGGWVVRWWCVILLGDWKRSEVWHELGKEVNQVPTFSRSQLFGRVWKPASNEVWAVIKLGLLPWCIFVACWPLRTRRRCKVWKVPLSSLVFKAEDMVGFPLFFLPWPVPIDIKKTTLLSRLPLHMQCLLAQGWHRNWRSFGRVGNSKCHARYKFWDNSLAAIRWIRPAYWLASGAGDDSEKNLGWIRQMIPIPGRGGFLESSGIHPVGNPGSLTLLNKKGGDGETRSFQLCPPTVSLPVLADLMIPWMGFKRSYLKGDGNDEFVLEKMRVYDSEMSQPTWYMYIYL